MQSMQTEKKQAQVSSKVFQFQKSVRYEETSKGASEGENDQVGEGIKKDKR